MSAAFIELYMADNLTDEASSGKSRKGTVRNTDSFFKDDTNETRKITITPALFRDDSNTSTLISGEAKEVCYYVTSSCKVHS